MSTSAIPTKSFKAPMIYNPWFEMKGINAVVVPVGVQPPQYPIVAEGAVQYNERARSPRHDAAQGHDDATCRRDDDDCEDRRRLQRDPASDRTGRWWATCSMERALSEVLSARANGLPALAPSSSAAAVSALPSRHHWRRPGYRRLDYTIRSLPRPRRWPIGYGNIIPRCRSPPARTIPLVTTSW